MGGPGFHSEESEVAPGNDRSGGPAVESAGSAFDLERVLAHPDGARALARQIGNRSFARTISAGAAVPGAGRTLARDGDDSYDVDVVQVPEEERKGRNLPSVSAAAADPRANSDYIDNRITAAAWNIYTGGPLIWVSGGMTPAGAGATDADKQFYKQWTEFFGLGNAVLVPDSQFLYRLDHQPAQEDMSVYADRQTALTHVTRAPFRDETQPVGYYRARGGLIVPTVFSPYTAPRTVATVIGAIRKYSKAVADELTVLALGLAGGVVVGVSIDLGGTVLAGPKETPKINSADLDSAASTTESAATTRTTTSSGKGPAPATTAKPPGATAIDEAPPTPRLVSSDEVTASITTRPGPGPGKTYGENLGQSLLGQGKSGPGALKPIANDLNANSTLTPAAKADAAKTAVDVAGKPANFSAGPVVQMGDYYVVPGSIPAANTRAMVVKPDGTVVFGYVDVARASDLTRTYRLLRLDK